MFNYKSTGEYEPVNIIENFNADIKFVSNALCLICLRPNKIWCNFLNDFINYKIFIIIDDNNFDYTELQNIYTNISFIKIDNSKCKANYYFNVNTMINKLISGWDKALYYFSIENTIYDFIWFLEDDVFFYNENVLFNIDKKYSNADLISKKCNINTSGKKINKWHWKKIDINYELPYYNGMMCIVRLSKKMLNCINVYAKKNKTLFFLEALFPTVAIKNNLIHNSPIEFENIYYRHNITKEQVNKVWLYHPVKDMNAHIVFRKL